jgi:hypothetical protein
MSQTHRTPGSGSLKKSESNKQQALFRNPERISSFHARTSGSLSGNLDVSHFENHSYIPKPVL